MRNKKGSLVKVDSSEVQGEGSYVVLRRPKWKAMRKEGMGAFQAAGGEGNASEAGLAMMDALLPSMIVDWNWTDDDDNPLPLPSTDRSVLDDLEMEEALWLVERITPLVKIDRKNSGMPR